MDGWRRRTFASFGQPAFRTYYVGLLCNMAGFWLRIAATGWFVWNLRHSREDLGWITLASMLPWVPVAPLAGVWAERVDQRRYLVAVYVGVAAVNAALATGILAGCVGWPEVLGATLVVAALRGMELPARHAIVRRLVDLPQLPNAIGLNAAGFHFMNAVGFGAAGVLYAVGGPAACFFSVAGAALLMAWQLTRLELAPQARPQRRQHPLRDLQEGFGYVRHHGITRTLVLSAGAVVALLLSFRTLMPAIADDRLGLGSRGYGVLMALGGVGSFGAALWVASGSGGRGRRVRNIFTTVWVGCGAVGVVGWAPWAPLVALGLLCAGFAQVGFMASANSTVQEMVPDHLRARVMGIWALIFGAAYPLGGMLQGFCAERFGERWALTGGATLALVLSLFLYFTSYGRLTAAVREELRKSDEQLAAGQVGQGL